jgi:hypothetical protein
VEVHPPHNPLHTWKDFWIHLGTITIGLLIALGLEATVEWMHRLHLAHELESSLHSETARNDQYIGNAITAAIYTSSQFERQLFLAKAALPGATNSGTIPALAPAPPLTGTSPDTAVWNSARQSASIALLPNELAQQYSDNYAEEAIDETLLGKATDRMEAVRAFARTLSNQPADGDLNLRAFSSAQLQEYIGLLALAVESLRSAAGGFGFYRVHNRCILDGAHSHDEMASCLKKNVYR